MGVMFNNNPMIDHSTIQRILDATDIVDVVKEFVTLRKAGVNYKGLCPFHNERTPSFVVSPTKQLCKCFSCGKGGNAVNFVMEMEQMTYPEAIKWLGKKYGIEVKEKELTNEERALQSERESLFALNEWADKYFQETLHNHVDGVAKGMAYFRSRGFRDDIIRKFHLGYALEQRDATAKAALQQGFSEKVLAETGICFNTEEGRLLDRYHGRVIFPVHTVSGRVVAFGGRILGADKKLAKYVNSPESIIYSKSRELYGLYQAKQAIVRKGCCFLVEGYTDVISMHQSGIENVVASSGTSLTEGQIKLLHRFTDNITVLYDGDSAGIKASLRGIDMLLKEGMHIKVLLLPDGDDPDSFARKHPAEAFQAYIDRHQVDFIRFKTNLLLQESANDPLKKASLISDVVKSISVIPDNIVRQMYIRECSTLLDVQEGLIVNEINKLKSKPNDNTNTDESKPQTEGDASLSPSVTQPRPLTATDDAENMLVALVVKYGEMPMLIDNEETQSERPQEDESERGSTITVAEYIGLSLEQDGIILQNPVNQKILCEAMAHIHKEGWTARSYFTLHQDATISGVATEMSEDKFILSKHQQELYVPEQYRLDEVVPRILNDYKHKLLKNKLNQMLNNLKNPEKQLSQEQAASMMQEYMRLVEIERRFASMLGDRVLLR